MFTPSQLSTASQTPADARHTAVLLPSGGQAALDPVQFSAGSQTPADARHTVVAGWKRSVGQAALAPVHVSAVSHAPAAGRHTAPALPAGCWQVSLVPSHVSVVHGFPSSVHAVPLPFFASVGQLVPVPGQVSTRSHSPAAERQTVVDDANASAGQLLLVPVQSSATSQSPATARQTVLEDAKPLAGHVELVPVHVSATSHSPATARHTAPALPAGCWHTLLEPLQVSVVHGLPSSVHAVPFALNRQVVVQHDPAVPLLAPSSHDSLVSRMPLPQIGSGDTDQPDSGRLSSRILPLKVSGYAVADAPPAPWKPIVAACPLAAAFVGLRYFTFITLEVSWIST